MAALTSRHVLQSCDVIAAAREKFGIERFMVEAASTGATPGVAYEFYQNGYDSTGKQKVDVGTWVERGRCLRLLQEEWLGKWGVAPN